MTEHLSALPDQHPLGKYKIIKVLGSGGFGITYLAHDSGLNRWVAIKEYMPSDLAVRTDRITVRAKSAASQDDFNWGAKAFIQEARTLSRFEHPNIVMVFDFFQANGTAYIVMKYVEGGTIWDALAYGTIPQDELKAILFALCDGLKGMHREGFMHRDIKPANIILRGPGDPVLIDFGAARQILGSRSRPLTRLLTPGYAPIEQYATNAADLGPWSDIYALGAIAYHALTGNCPPEAVSRIRNDPLVPLAEAARTNLDGTFVQAIQWSLAVFEDQRPRDVEDWLQAIQAAPEPIPKPNPVEDRHRGGTVDDAPAIDVDLIEVDVDARQDMDRESQKKPIETDVTPSPIPVPWPWKRITAWLVLGLLVLGIGTGVLKLERAPDTVFHDTLKDGSAGPEMVMIPAGEFRMGDLSGDGANDEKPVHKITIANAFALGRYEVSNAEYRRCVEAGACKSPETYTGFTGDKQPVVGVSWNDAVAYAEWVKKETGKPYRLPSEAEWEYAARAGSDTAYSWGDEIGTNLANCDGCDSEWDDRVTAPVGSFAKNAFGLFDMHGNVWEWVEDCWHGNYNRAPETTEAWTTGGDCTRRVRRGGSWTSGPVYVRAAYRYGNSATYRNDDRGFRLAQD